MSNRDIAGWACPTFASGVSSLSTRSSCMQGRDGKGVSGGKEIREKACQGYR